MLLRQGIKTVTHVVEVLRFAQNRKRRHVALSFLQSQRREKLQMNRLGPEDLKENRWWQPTGEYQRFHCTGDRRSEAPRFHLTNDCTKVFLSGTGVFVRLKPNSTFRHF
jgi:hypothetical protein